jgi:Tfp pilus assembly protein PilF
VQELKTLLPPEQYLRPENQLRIALEDRSQQVLLRYLAGEQVAQTRDDFAAGALYVGAASLLTPESLYLRARNDFFQGRTLLFDKKYSEATELLERSIEIDPTAAYAYNALGIAYLEQADFKHAGAAFRDATRRAPYWAYPLHNLALTYVETGNNQLAIREYQNAMRLAPDASYLPYNLGLVYQRINRRREAEAAYRKAIALAPQSGEPYNALGALKTTEGKRAEAERLYRRALEKNEALLPARHNLALLLWNVTGRRPEAIDLWRANLKRVPEYLPSLLSLADALAEQGDINQAIQEYRIVLKLKPDYVAAHLVLARLLQKAGEPAAALEELREASKREPENPIVLEQIGDLNRAEGRATEAKEAYEAALRQTADGTTRKRLREKLKVK